MSQRWARLVATYPVKGYTNTSIGLEVSQLSHLFTTRRTQRSDCGARRKPDTKLPDETSLTLITSHKLTHADIIINPNIG